MFSECDGEVDPDYLPYMEFNKTSNKLKIECRGMNECTTNRCLCDTEFLVKIISASVTETGGTLDLNENNKYLSGNSSVCEKMGGGLQPDGCCGNAPAWRPYNTAQKTCDENGVLRNPALFPTSTEAVSTVKSEEVQTEEGPTQGQVNDELVDNIGNLVGLVTEGTIVS